MKPIYLTLLIACISFSSFAGDILILKNELVYEGKIARIKNCELVFKIKGEKYVIPASDIYSVEFENPEDKVYSNYMKLAANDPNKCLSGSLDAENFHGKKGGHFVLGVLFGPFAMIGTALANPTPERGRHTLLKSQNNDQFNDLEYLTCYKRKARGQLILAEALGWGAWIVFVLAASGGQ
ncbi:MAG: hypothetical protein RBS73_10350 [Prolixibacteraceae bacterium]|jgi:hypothetical protein|nr:hypothetical protein [Prolixibacteraceae bacterium]